MFGFRSKYVAQLYDRLSILHKTNVQIQTKDMFDDVCLQVAMSHNRTTFEYDYYFDVYIIQHQKTANGIPIYITQDSHCIPSFAASIVNTR